MGQLKPLRQRPTDRLLRMGPAAGTGRFPFRVLLGVSGGIAAYKSALLVRELVKAGAEVRVVMTPSAHDFVTPLTLSTLSRHEVLTELVDRHGDGRWNDHVALARWADVLLIAPATAHTLAKLAQGLCDNLLLACCLSATCPLYVAPAMDLEMYRDRAVRANLATLAARGVRTIGPEDGELASGLVGEGRMTEPTAIVDRLRSDLMGTSSLAGRRVLITAGPTQEPIDPVRYIGNRSSGRMGVALADEAARRGAIVSLVAGPILVAPTVPGIERTDVTTAAEMADACERIAPACDLVIMSAAVADFRPAEPATAKMKKGASAPVLTLEPTKDILAALSAARPAGQRLIGFALETHEALRHARQKLERKGLDLLVMNTLADVGAGFGVDTNKVTLLAPDTPPVDLPLMSKADVARAILDRAEDLFPRR